MTSYYDSKRPTTGADPANPPASSAVSDASTRWRVLASPSQGEKDQPGGSEKAMHVGSIRSWIIVNYADEVTRTKRKVTGCEAVIILQIRKFSQQDDGAWDLLSAMSLSIINSWEKKNYANNPSIMG